MKILTFYQQQKLTANHNSLFVLLHSKLSVGKYVIVHTSQDLIKRYP